MRLHRTKGRHAASSPTRRPACGPIPLPATADELPVRPSMELPDGHMATRPQSPGPVYVGTVLARQRSTYHVDDVIRVTGGVVHVGRRGIVRAAYGNGRPLVVEIDGGIVYLDEDDVRLARRPVDEATEQFSTVHVAVPVSVVEARHADGTPVGYWPPAPDADAPTLVMETADPLDARFEARDTELAVELDSAIDAADRLVAELEAEDDRGRSFLRLDDVVRVTTFGELYDECVGRIVEFAPTRRDGRTVTLEILTAIPTLHTLVGRRAHFKPTELGFVHRSVDDDDAVLMGGGSR